MNKNCNTKSRNLHFKSCCGSSGLTVWGLVNAIVLLSIIIIIVADILLFYSFIQFLGICIASDSHIIIIVSFCRMFVVLLQCIAALYFSSSVFWWSGILIPDKYQMAMIVCTLTINQTRFHLKCCLVECLTLFYSKTFLHFSFAALCMELSYYLWDSSNFELSISGYYVLLNPKSMWQTSSFEEPCKIFNNLEQQSHLFVPDSASMATVTNLT